MAVRVVNLTKTIQWEWDQDPDKGTDNATKFEFRPLDAYEQAYLNDRLTSMEGGGTPAGTTEEEILESLQTANMRTEVFKVAVEAFRIACIGITNLQDEAGEPVEFKRARENIGGKAKMVVAPEVAKAIPPMLALSAYKQIIEFSTVSKVEEKNSEPAS